MHVRLPFVDACCKELIITVLVAKVAIVIVIEIALVNETNCINVNDDEKNVKKSP